MLSLLFKNFILLICGSGKEASVLCSAFIWGFGFLSSTKKMYSCSLTVRVCTYYAHILYTCVPCACMHAKQRLALKPKTGASGVPSASHTALMRAEGFKEKGGE